VFVVFTLVVTDFGIAKVIGGQFNVLATDAYKQVIGQQNFEMGAVVGFVLLVPAVIAFVLDRHMQRGRWRCSRSGPCRCSRVPARRRMRPSRRTASSSAASSLPCSASRLGVVRDLLAL
jgi:iron(III) transport system permease protein